MILHIVLAVLSNVCGMNALEFANLTNGLTSDNDSLALANPCQNKAFFPSEEAVRSHILKGYEKAVRPRKNSRDTVEVQIYLVVQRINKIVEKEQEIHFTGYLGIGWYNEYFVWNDTDDLSCIESIHLPSDDVWMPDVAITNSGDIYEVLRSPGHKIEVSSNGQCVFYPETTFRVFCSFDLTYFPFDDQLCSISVESWLSTAKMQRFNLTKPSIYLIHWSENEMWDLVGTGTLKYTVSYEIDTTEYDRIEFMFYLKRKAAYYNTNVIIPSTIISAVELVTFTLPTAEVLKMVISFTALLAYTVFQLMIVEDVPRSGTKTPALSIYIVLQMAYIGLALLGEGIIYLLIDNAQKQKPVPKWLDRTARVVGCLLLFPPDKENVKNAEKQHHMKHDLANGSAVLETSSNGLQLDEPNGRAMEMNGAVNDNIVRNSTQSISELAVDSVEVVLNATFPAQHQRRLAMIVDDILRKMTESNYLLSLRHQWMYIANVSKRIVFIVYFSCVTLTPLIMFLVIPMSKPDLCKTTVDCFSH